MARKSRKEKEQEAEALKQAGQEAPKEHYSAYRAKKIAKEREAILQEERDRIAAIEEAVQEEVHKRNAIRKKARVEAHHVEDARIEAKKKAEYLRSKRGKAVRARAERARSHGKKVWYPPYLYPVKHPRHELVCAIDEAGRGTLMGDLVVAAVVIGHNIRYPVIPGLVSSRKLNAEQRTYMASLIKRIAFAWSIGTASPQEIDRMGIQEASFLAMKRAVGSMTLLKGELSAIIVDGPHFPDNLGAPTYGVMHGEKRVSDLSAASILAKTYRDQYLHRMDALHPEYHFLHHKGYATEEHLALLKDLPILPCYRLSYHPIQEMWLEQNPGGQHTLEERLGRKVDSASLDFSSIECPEP